MRVIMLVDDSIIMKDTANKSNTRDSISDDIKFFIIKEVLT